MVVLSFWFRRGFVLTVSADAIGGGLWLTVSADEKANKRLKYFIAVKYVRKSTYE